MSVKTIIDSPAALPSATSKDFKAKFFAMVKKLAAKHNSEATAAPCFIATANKYKDGEGFLCLFGKMNKWKKYAKDTAQAESAARGYCFVSTDEKGIMAFNFMPVAGKIKDKEALISKAMREVVSQSKLSFVLCKGEFVDNDALDAATEAMDETPEVVENETTATEAKPNATKKEVSAEDKAAASEALKTLQAAYSFLYPNPKKS